MTQETVEKFLGRILTDGVLRKRFFADRARHLAELDLLDHERESLLQLDRHAVECLAACLDARIARGWRRDPMRPHMVMIILGAIIALGACSNVRPHDPGPTAAAARAGAETAAADLMSAEDRARLDALAAARAGSADGDDGYRIGADDLLDVRIPDLLESRAVAPSVRPAALGTIAAEPAFQQGIRVPASGVITVPLVGDVRAVGLTARELESEIAGRIVAEDLLRAPQVSVQITEYRSRVVSVVGSVERPGSYPLTRANATIGDLIWAAGGPTKDAGRVVEFVSGDAAASAPIAAGPNTLAPAVASSGAAIRLDLDHLLRVGKEGRPLGPPLRPGDVINVSPAGSVLVDGWVAKPGSYPVTRGLTLSGAVAAAGGTVFAADRQHATVQRVRGSDDRQLFTVDLDAIGSGHASDPPISDGDVIRLPADTARLVPWGAWVATREMLHVGGSIPLF